MMGTSTALQGNIYNLNGADPKDVIEFMAEYELAGTYYEKWTVENCANIPADGLDFNDYESRAGTSAEVAGGLMRLGVTYMLWEDPAEEWLGELHMYHPALGDFESQCDSEGSALLTDHQAKSLMVDGRWDQAAIHEIDELLGVTYQNKFTDLVKREST